MALEDKDIFNAIFSRFSDQPIEFIMEQYEKAKRLNIEIEKRQSSQTVSVESSSEIDDVVIEPSPKGEAIPKKKYTKRSLLVKPEEAIGDERIKCCICGEEKTILSSKHLAKHGISVEDYRALCSYDKKQPLMSKNREAQSKIIIAKAQQARMKKKSSK